MSWRRRRAVSVWMRWLPEFIERGGVLLSWVFDCFSALQLYPMMWMLGQQWHFDVCIFSVKMITVMRLERAETIRLLATVVLEPAPQKFSLGEHMCR
ncbi:uncharacterized protein EI97DRAFT_227617 [Westerdykella ornata]|uniref:Uncharacterized protein n=1 Tax=Westerdykella ornata TaxID=318751 RepID=A0A6A6JSL6_WESOR|nr:uncharacterized protein EI97DRAFT_227617 [Westerdykella ornata]KAF2279103.1 hypothetical protein EI97DRAFT_227617 [Westerdykella ornata]